MDLLNSMLNLVVPPASMLVLALSWPTLTFINACESLYGFVNHQEMEDKVVIITGASSGIGEHIAYEYARRRAVLVLVAKRENRLRGISDNAKRMGAKHVMIVAADVVKEEDCRIFIIEAVNFYGRVDHLVNATSLGHTFYFEEATDTAAFPHLMDINFWGNVYPTYIALPFLRQSGGRIIVNASVETWLPLPRMSLYSAAKFALVNFYETLRVEVKEEVGITIATHGWIGAEISRGKFLLEEGAEMQWKEEREIKDVEKFARFIVNGACRGDAYVKCPRWYDCFLLYRAFASKVLNWTLRLLLSATANANGSMRGKSLLGTGIPVLEGSSSSSYPQRRVAVGLGAPYSFTHSMTPQQLKLV